MICRKCGKEIDDDAVFCYACGKAIQSSNSEPREEKSSPKTSKKRMLIAVAVGLVVLMIAAIVINIFIIDQRYDVSDIKIAEYTFDNENSLGPDSATQPFNCTVRTSENKPLVAWVSNVKKDVFEEYVYVEDGEGFFKLRVDEETDISSEYSIDRYFKVKPTGEVKVEIVKLDPFEERAYINFKIKTEEKNGLLVCEVKDKVFGEVIPADKAGRKIMFIPIVNGEGYGLYETNQYGKNASTFSFTEYAKARKAGSSYSLVAQPLGFVEAEQAEQLSIKDDVTKRGEVLILYHYEAFVHDESSKVGDCLIAKITHKSGGTNEDIGICYTEISQFRDGKYSYSSFDYAHDEDFKVPPVFETTLGGRIKSYSISEK